MTAGSSKSTHKRVGVCKLTLATGPFVESHLLPKALTKSAVSGMPFLQGGDGARPKRRWSSWYDCDLVTAEGEKILADYDDWAIKELHRLKLVWGSWKSDRLQVDGHLSLPGMEGRGVRTVEPSDGKRLRLFFLSFLWRAAASDRYEFADISLPQDHLERLRLMLVTGNAEPISFYPVQLIQLSTKGETHNLTPVAMEKRVSPDEDTPPELVPVYRFYMDGLIAHVHRHARDDEKTRALGPLVVGNESKIAIATVSYAGSFEKNNLERLKTHVPTA